MGKKDKGMFWSNVGTKPKGFIFVKGESMTYTYEVPILTNKTDDYWNKYTIDKIFIKVKLKSVTELGFGGIDIDKEQTELNIKHEIGKDVTFDYEDNSFMRDGRMFPFVSSITIYKPFVQNYKQHRLLKARKEKINKFINKLNG